MLEEKRLRVRLNFTNPILGSASADPNIHEKFIASKAPDAQTREQEIAAIGVEEAVEKAMTVFPRNANGEPIMWAYQVKGFFKESCGFLRDIKGSESSKLKAYKKKIDGLVFVYPEDIVIHTDREMTTKQRSLRAQTMQGDRVALANSEEIRSGAYVDFDILYYNEEHLALIKEWLDYGVLHGFGQWRNAGFGTFTWEEAEDRENYGKKANAEG